MLIQKQLIQTVNTQRWQKKDKGLTPSAML